jgi:hypothetical protein
MIEVLWAYFSIDRQLIFCTLLSGRPVRSPLPTRGAHVNRKTVPEPVPEALGEMTEDLGDDLMLEDDTDDPHGPATVITNERVGRSYTRLMRRAQALRIRRRSAEDSSPSVFLPST